MTQAPSGSVAGRLAGRHLLLTGVTGFVGEALLHLLLHEVPDVRVSLLVRPKGSTGGAARIAKLLEKPVFAQAVADAGGVDADARPPRPLTLAPSVMRSNWIVNWSASSRM